MEFPKGERDRATTRRRLIGTAGDLVKRIKALVGVLLTLACRRRRGRLDREERGRERSNLSGGGCALRRVARRRVYGAGSRVYAVGLGRGFGVIIVGKRYVLTANDVFVA